MGRLAKVGHDKLLISLARVAPSTGTINGRGKVFPSLSRIMPPNYEQRRPAILGWTASNKVHGFSDGPLRPRAHRQIIGATDPRTKSKFRLTGELPFKESGNHRRASQFFCPACFPPIHGLGVKTDAEPRNWGKPNGKASNRDNLLQRSLTVAQAVLDRLEIYQVTTMATIETFNRGDEVLSKFPGGSIMTVLAVEGLKVRCSDNQDRQYWFDDFLLERYHQTRSGPDGIVPSVVRQSQVSN
jgi:hypothetical protein